tara:strand:+ start:49 stop:627 length:579 start_codon:yes stop_codon:yes gene_type:complete
MNDYSFYYWGPLLFKVKLKPNDLKQCAKLCSKKASRVNDRLAGVIKHEHYISTAQYSNILDPYLIPFRHAYHHWYTKPLTKQMLMVTAWVNFMRAGEFNPPHLHSDCDFSSVLFIKVPEKLKEENKKFTGRGGGPGNIAFMYGENQSYSITQKDILPEAGDLYIFPATLTHFVSPFMCKEERISMSANFSLN